MCVCVIRPRKWGSFATRALAGKAGPSSWHVVVCECEPSAKTSNILPPCLHLIPKDPSLVDREASYESFSKQLQDLIVQSSKQQTENPPSQISRPHDGRARLESSKTSTTTTTTTKNDNKRRNKNFGLLLAAAQSRKHTRN